MDLSSIAGNINYRYQQSTRMQIGGVVSGLDTASIIDKLMEAESLPLQRLNNKYLNYTNLQKAYKTLSEKLRDFYNFASDFSLQSNLIPKIATSSTNVLSAKASAGAVEGVYSIDVLSVATNSVLQTRKFGKTFTDESSVGDINTRYEPKDSTVKISINGSEQTVEILKTDKITDVIQKLQEGFGADTDIDISFSDGKLRISSNKVFQISNVEGNFTSVFRLNDSYLKKDGDNYVLESSGDIGAYSSLKTISDLQISGNQTLTINGVNIALKDTDSISTLVSKINSSTANVVANYDDKNGKIVLTSKTTGDNVINVTSDNPDLINKLGFSNGEFTLGQVANLRILANGYSQEVTSRTNDITFNGITLNLSSTGFTTVAVSVDKDKIVENVKEFVKKWNELTDFIYTKLSENKVTSKSEDEMSEEEKLQGLLKNNTLLRRVFEKLRSFLTTKVDGKSLADLGITSGDVGKSFENTMKGKITLDENKLKAFIDNNGSDAVWKFFGNSDGTKGLAVQIKEYSYQLTKFNGEIDTVAGVNGRLESEKRLLSKRMVSMLEYLQKKEEALWAKYSSLESALAKLSAQSNFISQAFSSNKQ
ncbi:MAG TPA: flagellar filament capping protein FliD [Fervidobacterium sp.]|nr:flagellar filament capping protein FliD [Fervidobacterium sp.]HPT53370.1 flagellar filament capping protein FliD [Fervidobacterium sp.]HPZ16890.1 flagellar filament capping protein FliD [Fervidobacterium sp.]HQE47887.1 flagellar filament capping protein FliD [Fervidobacterium sp.]HUM42054.1 flagellar filament capping protein FliD [Fervidobacterium sp.]